MSKFKGMTTTSISNRVSQANDPYIYLLLTAFLWVGALAAGYFFEVAFLLLNSFLFLGLSLYIWRYRETPLRISLWHGILICFLGLYWVSTIYAVDPAAAIHEAAKFTSLLPLAILISTLNTAKFDSYLRQWAWAGTFLTVWGWLLDLSRNGRLESTLGYANTLAILLAAGIWIAWKAFNDNHGKSYIMLILIQFVGLLQTGSRTVLVLFLCICLFELLRLRGRRQLLWVGTLIAGVAVTAALAFFFKLDVLQRFKSINWNASEFQLRRVYWTDGMALFKEHWIGGLGGGGWAVEHSSWYFVKYLHQFYIEMALEVGIGGILLFAMLVIVPFIRTRKRIQRVSYIWILIVLLLLHVIVDVDFEYPLCFGLLIILLSHLESLNPLKLILIKSTFGRNLLLIFCLVLSVLFSWLTLV